MKTKHFFYTFPNKIMKLIINVNTGSANGQGWGVIDFPRNQSACWESKRGVGTACQSRGGSHSQGCHWRKRLES